MISTGRREPLEPITTSELLNGSEKWKAQFAWLVSPPRSVRAGDAFWEVRRAACARQMPYGKSAAQCARGRCLMGSPPRSVRAGDALWEVRRTACVREMPYGKSAARSEERRVGKEGR